MDFQVLTVLMDRFGMWRLRHVWLAACLSGGFAIAGAAVIARLGGLYLTEAIAACLFIGAFAFLDALLLLTWIESLATWHENRRWWLSLGVGLRFTIFFGFWAWMIGDDIRVALFGAAAFGVASVFKTVAYGSGTIERYTRLMKTPNTRAVPGNT